MPSAQSVSENKIENNAPTISPVDRLVCCCDGQTTFNCKMESTCSIEHAAVTHDVCVDLTQVVECQLG